MADANRGVVYTGPGHVEVQDLDYPKLELPEQNNRQLQHGVILRVVATNICGSDQHMVRGRTTAPEGQTLGHEITGEVIEVGRDVEYIKVGDICSVPFNIACGRCRNCMERNTGVCENVNPARAGAAYGYVDMGGWVGGQAEYVTVPDGDFKLLKFPDRDQAMAKIRDLAMLSDIFPTGYHGAFTAGVTTGSTVYVAGAGPVGLGWAKSHYFTTGQCPVMKYHRGLMMSILHDKAHIADAVNATVITLDRAPQGYKDFDKGAAKKFVLDPHRMIPRS